MTGGQKNQSFAGEINWFEFPADFDPPDDLHYLRMKAPPGHVAVASSRVIPEFSRPWLTKVSTEPAKFKLILNCLHKIYIYIQPLLPLNAQCPEVTEAVVAAAEILNYPAEGLFAEISERRLKFDLSADSGAFPINWGIRLIPKDPPALDITCARRPRIETVPYLDGSPRRPPAAPAGSAAAESLSLLERYWEDEQRRSFDPEIEDDLRRNFEDEFGRDFDPDFDPPFNPSEFDFEEWDRRVDLARDAVLDSFFHWTKANLAAIEGQPPAVIEESRLVIEELFRFCYQSETGEILKLQEIKRSDLRLFVLEHLLCTVFQEPADYMCWGPLLRLFFRFLGECGYRRYNSKLDTALRDIDRELVEYLIRQYG